jgi:hypothetical protein
MSPTRQFGYKKRKLVAVKRAPQNHFSTVVAKGGRIISGNYNREARGGTSLYNL